MWSSIDPIIVVIIPVRPPLIVPVVEPPSVPVFHFLIAAHLFYVCIHHKINNFRIHSLPPELSHLVRIQAEDSIGIPDLFDTDVRWNLVLSESNDFFVSNWRKRMNNLIQPPTT